MPTTRRKRRKREVPVTAADLRALLARKRVKMWEMAFKLGINPTHLSAMLNERRALNPDVATRLVELLEADNSADLS